MRSLTYANVMSTIAVFGVLGGGSAWAAATIGANDIKRNAIRAKHIHRNAIQARHISTNAVSSAKLRDGAVATSKLGDGAVVTAKLGDSAVSAAKLADGAVTGSKIASGAVDGSKLAAAIPRDVELIQEDSTLGSTDKDVELECPAGKLPIGGGATAPTFGATGFVALTASSPMIAGRGIPSTGKTGWYAAAIEVNGGSTEAWGITVWLICARL
jgi:hypothetical protein